MNTFIVRGFNNMVEIMHSKYIQFLNEAGLGKDLFSLIMKNASSQIVLHKDATKTTLTQSEIKIDQMRIKALTSNKSLRKATPHNMVFSESRDTAFI